MEFICFVYTLISVYIRLFEWFMGGGGGVFNKKKDVKTSLLCIKTNAVLK